MMKRLNRKFVLVTLVSVLLSWRFIEAVSPQDVPRPDHMVVASIGEPESVDPAWVYDTGSAELIFNVYETLIFYDRESVDEFVPMLATDWWISEDSLTYTFKIREGVKFHNGDTLTTEDVEYSFERVMVQDRSGGPAWMLYEVLLGCWEANLNDPDWGVKIEDTVQSNTTHVWFNLASSYAPFPAILSQSWSSIVNKKFCVEHGDWPGTWDSWQQYHDPEVSPLDSPEPVMMGTGPYKFDYWEKGVEWSFVKNDEYWGGWPAVGCRGYVTRVTEKIIFEWVERRDMFLAGDADMVYVTRMYVQEVWGQPGIRCIYPLPSLGVTSGMFFNFNISTRSPWIGEPPHDSGAIHETGVPVDFFSDVDVRKGFAYSFNYTKYIEEVYLGEAAQPATCVVNGLPYYDPNQERYHFNLTKAKEHFMRAWDGQVWEKGFTMDLVYNMGHEARQLACEMIAYNVESLNPKFHIGVVEIEWWYLIWPPPDWPPYLPVFLLGWLGDYPDPHNFIYPFMHSDGVFSYYQRYNNATVDALIDEALKTTNTTRRREIYYQLQSIYHDDCPSVPMAQPLGRHWERTWVQGWYYNPAYPGNYFYHLWKHAGLHGDLNSDGIVNIEDIAIIAKAFASYPGHPRWNEIADVDKNDIVNIIDVAKVAKEFGNKLESPTASCRQDGLEFNMTLENTYIHVGESVEITLTVTNISNESLTIWFGSGQSFDLYLYESGLPIAKWSDDKAFFQMVWDVKLESGESFSETLPWNFYTYDSNGYVPPSPGVYELVAICKGMVGDSNINVMPGMQIELFL